MIESIDAISLNFDPGSLLALNLILGFIMFGIALSLRVSDFREVAKRPRAPLIGMLAQFLLLPAATWALTRLLELPPSISLGMILVSSCPGGNISNLIAHLSRANTALSISLTAVSTAAAVFMTPLNVSFWGSMSPDTAALLTDFNLNPLDMFLNVLILLGLPLIAGMSLRAKFPTLADRALKPFKILSILLFIALVTIAFQSNFSAFVAVIGIIFLPVALHNALAWAVGYSAAKAARLPKEDVRAVAIEVAIQNSGLGLVLTFAFFDGLGGMAVIAGWWGIWHVIAGLTMATIWSRTAS
ncbi:bile acid:sodium symporter family protein [Bradymonas sediminis]|uniref:Bile acid:sodium symporter family protein n=1 Tax=Bradymonas sediminis TaxID=1548548 RepID=A0A2Z4FQ54_9DELT|nr:bile acid:sodium symporter family protein [Bradymonas sediminis]AWV91050.1 bile acid:sodium symporter family protein [Bradymonas sediminis]TDP75209.1 BASS family bile acid:Na+ symporter [Bradymonas sediminis]